MVCRAAAAHTAARGLTGLQVFQRTQFARFLICAAVLVAGCGARTETELSRSPSPDGKLVAYVVHVDPGGGATVAFINYVYLSEAGHDRNKTANFEGYSCGPRLSPGRTVKDSRSPILRGAASDGSTTSGGQAQAPRREWWS